MRRSPLLFCQSLNYLNSEIVRRLNCASKVYHQTRSEALHQAILLKFDFVSSASANTVKNLTLRESTQLLQSIRRVSYLKGDLPSLIFQSLMNDGPLDHASVGDVTLLLTECRHFNKLLERHSFIQPSVDNNPSSALSMNTMVSELCMRLVGLLTAKLSTLFDPHVLFVFAHTLCDLTLERWTNPFRSHPYHRLSYGSIILQTSNGPTLHLTPYSHQLPEHLVDFKECKSTENTQTSRQGMAELSLTPDVWHALALALSPSVVQQWTLYDVREMLRLMALLERSMLRRFGSRSFEDSIHRRHIVHRLAHRLEGLVNKLDSHKLAQAVRDLTVCGCEPPTALILAARKESTHNTRMEDSEFAETIGLDKEQTVENTSSPSQESTVTAPLGGSGVLAGATVENLLMVISLLNPQVLKGGSKRIGRLQKESRNCLNRIIPTLKTEELRRGLWKLAKEYKMMPGVKDAPVWFVHLYHCLGRRSLTLLPTMILVDRARLAYACLKLLSIHPGMERECMTQLFSQPGEQLIKHDAEGASSGFLVEVIRSVLSVLMDPTDHSTLLPFSSVSDEFKGIDELLAIIDLVQGLVQFCTKSNIDVVPSQTSVVRLLLESIRQTLHRARSGFVPDTRYATRLLLVLSSLHQSTLEMEASSNSIHKGKEGGNDMLLWVSTCVRELIHTVLSLRTHHFENPSSSKEVSFVDALNVGSMSPRFSFTLFMAVSCLDIEATMPSRDQSIHLLSSAGLSEHPLTQAKANRFTRRGSKTSIQLKPKAPPLVNPSLCVTAVHSLILTHHNWVYHVSANEIQTQLKWLFLLSQEETDIPHHYCPLLAETLVVSLRAMAQGNTDVTWKADPYWPITLAQSLKRCARIGAPNSDAMEAAALAAIRTPSPPRTQPCDLVVDVLLACAESQTQSDVLLSEVMPRLRVSATGLSCIALASTCWSLSSLMYHELSPSFVAVLIQRTMDLLLGDETDLSIQTVSIMIAGLQLHLEPRFANPNLTFVGHSFARWVQAEPMKLIEGIEWQQTLLDRHRSRNEWPIEEFGRALNGFLINVAAEHVDKPVTFTSLSDSSPFLLTTLLLRLWMVAANELSIDTLQSVLAWYVRLGSVDEKILKQIRPLLFIAAHLLTQRKVNQVVINTLRDTLVDLCSLLAVSSKRLAAQHVETVLVMLLAHCGYFHVDVNMPLEKQIRVWLNIQEHSSTSKALRQLALRFLELHEATPKPKQASKKKKQKKKGKR